MKGLKFNKYFWGGLMILIFVSLVIVFVIFSVFSNKVIEANEYAVLYDNNRAEVIYRDDYANPATIEIYRGDIRPIYIDEEKSSRGFGPTRYILPKVNLVGNNKERGIFTIRNGERHGGYCDSDIFYVDRISKTAKVINTSLCIRKTLDEHIYTRFLTSEYLGIKQDKKSYFDIGVGDYSTGELIASASVEMPIWTDGESLIGWYGIDSSNAIANPEMTKVVFPVVAGPECGDSAGDCDTVAFIYVLDLETSEVRDVTPEKGLYFSTLYPSGQMNHSTLRYEKDNGSDVGRFIIVELTFPGDNEPYAVIDVEKTSLVDKEEYFAGVFIDSEIKDSLKTYSSELAGFSFSYPASQLVFEKFLEDGPEERYGFVAGSILLYDEKVFNEASLRAKAVSNYGGFFPEVVLTLFQRQNKDEAIEEWVRNNPSQSNFNPEFDTDVEVNLNIVDLDRLPVAYYSSDVGMFDTNYAVFYSDDWVVLVHAIKEDGKRKFFEDVLKSIVIK